jgi:hypothetical protein
MNTGSTTPGEKAAGESRPNNLHQCWAEAENAWSSTSAPSKLPHGLIMVFKNRHKRAVLSNIVDIQIYMYICVRMRVCDDKGYYFFIF